MKTLREVLNSITPEQQAFLDICAPGEPFPDRPLKSQGWVYKDLPQLTLEQFDTFVEVCGKSNIEWLATATRTRDGVMTKRGQMLLSPAGQENLKTYLEAS